MNYDTLVLSGGSTRSILMLGSIQYLIDNNILNNVQTYIGTSAGAILCFLLIIGYTPIEIMVFICTNQFLEKLQQFNIIAMINGGGASSFCHIYEQLERLTINKIGYIPTFQDIKNHFDVKLICITYNITENKSEYLSFETYPNLPCLIALRMSANIPLIFENYKYGNNFYIDGGVVNNFAVDLGELEGNKILGISIKSDSRFKNQPDMNIIDYFYNTMFIPISISTNMKIENVTEKTKLIELDAGYLKLRITNFSLNSTEKLNLFSNGYQQTKKVFE